MVESLRYSMMNKQTCQQREESGIRLMTLVQNHHAEILGREKGNNKFIHLYNTGGYWVAFERSACQLNRLFPECGIFLFKVDGRPEYVVMASVPYEKADAYFRMHIVRRDEPDYKVIAVNSLQTREYHKWYMGAVRSVL